MADTETLAQDPAAGLPLEEIRELCRRHGVQELYVFGSALRADFRPESDVDFLVLFQPGAERGWAAHMQDLEADLSRVIGRKADLISKRGVEQSRNWIRRRAILESARLVYAA